MNVRFCASLGALATAVVLLGVLPLAGQNQNPVDRADDWTMTYTPWGDPDLQGVYSFSTNTPLQRPETIADRDNYTEEELANLEASAAERIANDVVSAREGTLGSSYNNFWTSNEKGALTGRTSLIIDPPDGRLPNVSERAQIIWEAQAADRAERTIGEAPFTNLLYATWEDLPAYERCVARPMPRVWQSYNHGAQILQTPGFVVIHYESMNDVRIIPVDGRPQLDDNIRQWNGDSRGHWEGDTLVVEWTNFTDKQLFDGGRSGPPLNFPQGNMTYVERITRVDENTLNYEVTVDDPNIWASSWTFAMPWRGGDPNYDQPEDLYEFACHEGNYRMIENTLKGSRALAAEDR
jgi:hypothetical protein